MDGEKTYEMAWDCAYCGKKKLLGLSHRHCPNCGAPQDPSRRYFPPEHEKVAVQDHEYAGSDVLCPACRAPSSRAAQNCGQCGSPLNAGKEVGRQQDQFVGGPQGPPPPGGFGGPTPQMPMAPPQPVKKSGFPVGCIIAIVVAVLAVIGIFVVRAVWKKDVVVAVVSHEWRRVIDIEEFGASTEKKACDDMPSGAELIKKTAPEPVCTTRKVDNGDGTYKEKKECSSPKAQCEYKVRGWKVKRKVENKGGLKETPTWPTVRLGRTGSCDGCEREGPRRESYSVKFKEDDGTANECDVGSMPTMSTYAIGQKYAVKKHAFGGDLDCSTLKKK